LSVETIHRSGLSRVQLDIIIDILRPFSTDIETVALFGSRATGTYRDNSDIDIVLFGPVREQTIDRLRTCFDESPLPVKVDVNAYDQIEYPPLKAHIDHVKQPLFTKQDLQQ